MSLNPGVQPGKGDKMLSLETAERTLAVAIGISAVALSYLILLPVVFGGACVFIRDLLFALIGYSLFVTFVRFKQAQWTYLDMKRGYQPPQELKEWDDSISDLELAVKRWEGSTCGCNHGH